MGGASKAANAKATQQNHMTKAGQSSPSLLAGISQSEGVGIGNLKQTEQNEVNMTEEMNLGV